MRIALITLVLLTGCVTAGGTFYNAGDINQCPIGLLEKVDKKLEVLCQSPNPNPPPK